MSNTPSSQTTSESNRQEIPGFRKDLLTDLSMDDVLNNRVALNLIFNKYREYIDENTSLKQRLENMQVERRAFETFAQYYETKKKDSRLAAGLNVLASVFIGFGINYLTTKVDTQGIIVLTAGVAFALIALFLSIKD